MICGALTQLPNSQLQCWGFAGKTWYLVFCLELTVLTADIHDSLRLKTYSSGKSTVYYHSLSSRFLNAFTVGAETKFTGRAFHKFTTRCVKKCLRTSSLDRPFSSFSWWPRVVVPCVLVSRCRIGAELYWPNVQVLKCLQHIAPSYSAYESSKIQLIESLAVFEVTKAGNKLCCPSLDCFDCIDISLKMRVPC